MLATKWTSIVAVPAFALSLFLTADSRREGFRRLLWLAPGVILLVSWLAFFYAETGSLTSPAASYTQVNLWNNLTPRTLSSRLIVRTEQLLTYDGAWLLLCPAIAAAIVWARAGRWRAGADRTRDATVLLAGVCASYVVFLTASGYLLPRYFVPVEPLFATVGAAAIFKLARPRIAAAVVATVAVVIHLGWYGLTPGPRLIDASVEYYDLVESHRDAARWLEERAPSARVAANWLVARELEEPFNGYVTRPLRTVSIDSLPDDASALATFDVLYESPAPGTIDIGRAKARALGLVEVARFPVGAHVTVLWMDPRALEPSPQAPAAPAG